MPTTTSCLSRYLSIYLYINRKALCLYRGSYGIYTRWNSYNKSPYYLHVEALFVCCLLFFAFNSKIFTNKREPTEDLVTGKNWIDSLEGGIGSLGGSVSVLITLQLRTTHYIISAESWGRGFLAFAYHQGMQPCSAAPHCWRVLPLRLQRHWRINT